MEKILLDTDIGGDIDDAVCLAWLLKQPRCQLLGITTVCGEPEKRASVADAICKSAGCNIPIAAGFDRPLQPIPVYPTPEGAGALESWPHARFVQSDAAAFLYRKIVENPHEVTLIGIGAMTNIAVLLRDYPDTASLLKGLCLMNGYFGTEPLPQPWWNWNSWADPLASRLVFSAQIPIRTVSLEITRTLTITQEHASRLFDLRQKLVRCVLDFGNAWLTKHAGALTLHDPLAAVSVFCPEVCTYQRGFVQVETHNSEIMGATRFIPDQNGNVEIARSVDRNSFYRILSDTINR